MFTARHCFSLEDFVVHIALPSLVKTCNDGRGDIDIEVEAGARLTCHLLLRLFKTVECPQPALYSVSTSPHPLHSPLPPSPPPLTPLTLGAPRKYYTPSARNPKAMLRASEIRDARCIRVSAAEVTPKFRAWRPKVEIIRMCSGVTGTNAIN